VTNKEFELELVMMGFERRGIVGWFKDELAISKFVESSLYKFYYSGEIVQILLTEEKALLLINDFTVKGEQYERFTSNTKNLR
jgi:hypothetical protein